MHLSTFAARQIEAGYWVIDATSEVGLAQQLVGVYFNKAGADGWIADHPADWFKVMPTMTGQNVSMAQAALFSEPPDVLSLNRTIESLQRENAWLK